MTSENVNATAETQDAKWKDEIVAESVRTADKYMRMEYAQPENMRSCWDEHMPEIEEPTGAALHLVGAMAMLNLCRLITEGTTIGGGIELAMDHVASAIDILWPEESGETADAKATNDLTEDEKAEAILEVISRVNMDEAKSRAKSEAPSTRVEVLELMAESADMANWIHSAIDYANGDNEAGDDAREIAEVIKERAMDIMTDTMAAYYHLNGNTFADREESEDTADDAGTIVTLETTRALLDAMEERAEEFPITNANEAASALVDATLSTSALVNALLALTGTEDEQASDAILNCSKEAGSATINILRALGYIISANELGEGE